jgi:VIT1/CCC1 family predicted Fe2+/Mn2+ transporter
VGNDGWRSSHSILDPIDRVSEVLFGLIMVLTSTHTVSVVSAGRPEIRTMILAALGCNLAWGIIDAGLYVLGRIDERGRNLLTLRAVREAADPTEARRLIANALPKALSRLPEEHLEPMRREVLRLPEPPQRPGPTREDTLGALAVCLLVFLSTFPPVIPFLLWGDVQTALRISNAVAIVMMFVCGYAYARGTGLRPWLTGLVMVAIGFALVGIAIALGG